ncbi:MAG: hypothetical protein ABI577_03535 [bacterium]
MVRLARARLAIAAVAAMAIIIPVAVAAQSGESDDRSSESLLALGTSFTFQGRLTDAGSPANGVYDFNFYLYDSLAGGSQVGPVATVGDVTVTAGLFTVDLDFGDLFHGAKYFLEVQVRPGASAGSYAVLSPREAIGAVPNALHATEANALSLPYSASDDWGGALFEVSNSNAGANSIALLTEATAGKALVATSGSGTAGQFSSSSGTALEIDGPLKVGGTKPAAFIHTATVGNTSNHVTAIDNPATNNNPTAMLIVTQYWEGTYNPHEIGVFYSGGKWRIFNEDIATLPVGAEFNVLVINR